MSLYSYYIDAPNYAGASLDSVRTNINDILSVVEDSGEHLCYLHADKDAWLSVNDKEGEPLSRLWESDDMSFLNALSSLFSQYIINWKKAFKNPVEMDSDKDLDSEYNAFWGVNYGALGPGERYLDCYNDHLLFRRQCAETDIWKNRDVYFSRIKFAPDLERQLGENRNLASALLDMLKELDTLCINADSAKDFNDGITNTGFTDESDPVKSNPAFNRYRLMFVDRERGKQYCYFHEHVGDKVMYIYPDENRREITVVYLGRHLPTKKYPK